MIYFFLEKDWDGISMSLLIVLFTWVLVFFGISADLLYGIRRAKEAREKISSEGLRRTVRKFTFYYITMLFALFFDTLNFILPYLFDKPIGVIPIASIICCIALLITEYISIRERAEDKIRNKIDKSAMMLTQAILDREEALEKIIEKLENRQNNKKNE